MDEVDELEIDLEHISVFTARSYLFVAHIEQFVELNAAIRERPERPLFLHLCGDIGVCYGGISLARIQSRSTQR